MGCTMVWDSSMIKLAPEDFIVEGISEILRRAGFSEESREYRRKGSSRVVMIRGGKEDPFLGREQLTIAVLWGEADEEWLSSILRGEGRAYLISLDGEVKIEGVEVRGGSWLAEAFNRAAIEPPESLKPEKLPPESVTEFVLDGPLVGEFNLAKTVEEVRKVAAYRFGASTLQLEAIKLFLRPVYIVSWAAEDGSSSRGLIADGSVVLDAEKSHYRGLLMRLLLEDVATVRASSVEVEDFPDPEGVFLEASKERGLLGLKVTGVRRAYKPIRAEMTLKMGINNLKASLDLSSGRVEAEAEPLAGELIKREVIRAIQDSLGEAPAGIELARRGRYFLTRGFTDKYLFSARVNAYTGAVEELKASLREEVLLSLVLKKYPDGSLLGLERIQEGAIVDLFLPEKILVLRVDSLGRGIEVDRELQMPTARMGEILSSLGLEGEPENFTCTVKMHRFVECTGGIGDVTVRVKMDGMHGDIVEEEVAVGRDAAVSLALGEYGGFKAVFVDERESGYLLTLEGEREIIKAFVSRDGRVEERDRFLKGQIVEEIALKAIGSLEPKAAVEGLKLGENWEVHFTGSRVWGRVLVHRRDGRVLSLETKYTEKALVDLFEEFIREKYQDEGRVERIILDLGKDVAGIKAVGKKGTYFGRYDLRDGRLLESDFVQSGFASKLKLRQLESHYL